MNMDMKAFQAQCRRDLLEGCAPFWLNGFDRENGGILSCLDEDGSVFSEDKGVWMQGRCAWMYAHLYNHFEKKEIYLDYAGNCLEFAHNQCVDANGRMYTTVTRSGEGLAAGSEWFSEAFYIMGCAEYYRASGDPAYLQRARDYYDRVIGYYDDPQSDPRRMGVLPGPRPLKRFAEPMILLNVTGILRRADGDRESIYNARADRLVADIQAFHSNEFSATLEAVTPDNKIVLSSAPCRIMNPGHVIECSWFMLEEGIYRGNDQTCAIAQRMFDEAMAWGWDEDYGGILYNVDILKKPVEAYEQDLKVWWVHNEAIIASVMFYRYTGDVRYQKWFETLVAYGWKHLRHPDSGEWYGNVHRDGALPRRPFIGHIYKGPFHVMRMLSKMCLRDE